MPGAQKTIHETMIAVGRVAGVMNEIEASALAQSDGIGQVNKAVAQIDEVTQHSTTLVERAAAKSPEDHAVALSDAGAVVRLDARVVQAGQLLTRPGAEVLGPARGRT